MNQITTLSALALLYDRTAHELRNVIAQAAGGKTAIPLHGEQMQKKVQWLGEIAKTLSLVYQIEKLRNPASAAEEAGMPPEKIIDDPSMKNTKNNQPNVNQDLSQFQGWQPFQQ